MTDTTKVAIAFIHVLIAAIGGAVFGLLVGAMVAVVKYEPPERQQEHKTYAEVHGRQDCRGLEVEVLECMRGID